jgi:hypothetical protein
MTEPTDERLDEVDGQILDQVKRLYEVHDPPPPDLEERVRFAISLERADVEIARLNTELFIGSGARVGESSHTSTYDAESRTIMITLGETPDGRVRVDGWLAPAAALRVELRMAGAGRDEPASSNMVMSDDAGRFVFDRVRHGVAQLLVHPPEEAGSPTVVTPSLVL